jgi:hypothetical protein
MSQNERQADRGEANGNPGMSKETEIRKRMR